jgi:hypothetical protein
VDTHETAFLSPSLSGEDRVRWIGAPIALNSYSMTLTNTSTLFDVVTKDGIDGHGSIALPDRPVYRIVGRVDERFTHAAAWL